MKKQFIQERELIEDSFKLAVQIYQSGFKPSFIVGLWRGGSTVAIYVQECLQTLGINTQHISVRTSYNGAPAYNAMIANPQKIKVHGTRFLRDNLNCDDNLLIVDDVFSTGLNIAALKNKLQKKLKMNMPSMVKVATLYQRPSFNKTDFAPDFVLHQSEAWLVLPYEMQGLDLQQISSEKNYLIDILASVKAEFRGS